MMSATTTTTKHSPPLPSYIRTFRDYMASLLFVLLLFSAIHGSLSTISDHEIGFSNLTSIPNAEDDKLETYIVHVEHLDKSSLSSLEDLNAWHSSFLPPLTNNNSTSLSQRQQQQQRIIYSYQHVMSGFAVKLTRAEAKSMDTKTGIISCRPEKILSLHTTRSPTFLGLHHQYPPQVWKNSSFGEGVIIGSIDTGATIFHPSFRDQGMRKPPRKWKGQCRFAGNPCNNKIIGGGIFSGNSRAADDELLVDKQGHGTHTASTAAGNFVPGANLLGNAYGTAAGMAPLAHLAIYKLCENACRESDFTAAFDAALNDGVDLLSLSLSFGPGIPFFEDAIAIAAFRAAQKGIFVSCAAGNEGPGAGTVSNGAPWILTVGASTIDRRIKGILHLGNKIKVDGESLIGFTKGRSMSPLLYPEILSKNKSSAFCGRGTLKGMRVRGGIVLCDDGGDVSRLDKAQEVKEAGATVMVLINNEAKGYTIVLDQFDTPVLPTLIVSYAHGLMIKDYINSCEKPKAKVSFQGTVLGTKPAPSVAYFSARGPNLVSPDILKPDIVGPGVNILAAWPIALTYNDTVKNTRMAFNMLSGTSMACPHLTGIAALVKRTHPRWSPAAIKSAIMTSAEVVNRQGNPITDQTLSAADVFATGAGHVNPIKAMDPGFVYDMKASDYLPYLCGLGYNDAQVGIIVGRKVNCGVTPKVTGAELNYPSFSILLGIRSLTYKRRVRNVGRAPSCYEVVIDEPKGVKVHVDPPILCFKKQGQSVSYQVSFGRARTTKGENIINGSFVQGSLQWVSPEHVVRSPISVNFI